ncbi:MAG: hypothetical protein SPI06_07120 [Terrisporobacter sp.]|uniref:hypothetical protein n=1 Tax=Terrisporobacter sp. TaxID=1965305 RepID=UPI002A90D8FD|nr:hypothetical protein [Terrisporobacter sp.]MDY6153165.1 hypothetical protein [Terrisporobacter sp.]
MNDEFEELLQRQQNPNIDNKYTTKVFSTNNTKKCVIQKSDKGASLFDFIKMLDKIITLSMKNVSFVPDEGKTLALDSMKNMDKPLITYKVNKREIKDELKPRVRQEIEELDENNEKRTGDVYGQRFKCEIQFNIFSTTYEQAEDIMEEFETLMISFAGYFKRNGVAEIFFKQHITDDAYVKFRETFSVRNLIYYVEIEKLTVIFKEKIKEIETLAQENEDSNH